MRRYRVIFTRCGLLLLLTATMLFALPGCAPKIGDACTQSTDCSQQGNRACDTSQLGGYCTVFGCATNSCPDSASCVVFHVSIPGCAYNDYEAPARTARALCMAGCKSDSDCRGGYVCRDPRGSPWSAVVLDDTQQSVCMQAPLKTDAGAEAGSEGGPAADAAAVCVGSVPFPSQAGASDDSAASDAVGPGLTDAPGGG